MRHVLAAVSVFALAACGLNGTDGADDGADADRTSVASRDYGYETFGEDNLADTMASHDGSDPRSADLNIPDPEERPIMQAQVVLDRQGFGPGVVDGKMGMSTENALRGWQEAKGLDETGELDEATKQSLAQWDNIPATRVVRVPESWGQVDYTDTPADAEQQAKMQKLGYQSIDEKLAERFHTTVEVLKQLNPNGRPAGMEQANMSGNASATPTPGATRTASASPTPTPTSTRSGTPTPTPSASGTGFTPTSQKQQQATFEAGQLIRVPNIGADRIAPGEVDESSWQQTLASLGVGTQQTKVDRIVVSKSKDTLRAYAGDKLVGLYTVSSGSSQYPLPIGDWKILGEAYNPPFDYNPQVLSGSEGESYKLPPGPNGPVGVVWIDLSKEHYGIHGTPEPSTIGRAQSHGCVRLTNWDAARVAQMVDQSTKVEFVA